MKSHSEKISNAIVNRESCPVCSGKNLKTLYNTDFYGFPIKDFLTHYYSRNNIDFSFLSGFNFIIDECLTCELIFQKNILNDEYMTLFYDDWLTLPEETELRQESGYYSMLSKEVETIFNYIHCNTSKYKCLDFGAGWGDWSMAARARGAIVYAIELSTEKKNYLIQNGIIVLDLKTIPHEGFDFINTEQVFEHIPDPGELLKLLAHSLKPGGIIKLSVPNGENVKRNLINPDWSADRLGPTSLMPIQPLEHINSFNNKSLDYLASQQNLKPVKIKRINSNHGDFLNLTLKEFLAPIYRMLINKYSFNLKVYYRKSS